MHLARFGADGRRGYAVTDLPAGHMKHFVKRGDRHHPLVKPGMRQHTGVTALGKADVFIDLIVEDIDFTFGNRPPQDSKIFVLSDGG